MDPNYIPVIISTGQVTHNSDSLRSAQDLLTQAAQIAVDDANSHARGSTIQKYIDKVVAVNILGKKEDAPAGLLAKSLDIKGPKCYYTTVGGNTPQYLVNKFSAEIARGETTAVLISGAEAMASSKKYKLQKAEGVLENLDKVDRDYDIQSDVLLGEERVGLSEQEIQAGLVSPAHVYPMFESVIAKNSGRTVAGQRDYISELFAPFSEVASRNPYSWFKTPYTAAELATISKDNRPIADPYLKLHCAFLGSDQGAALILTTLAVATELKKQNEVIFVHAGADATDVWNFSARHQFDSSPAIEVASSACLKAAEITIDDISHFDLYSCFPSPVQIAIKALGLTPNDKRGFTVTGGLPYFGGPGNNYVSHSIASMIDMLKEHSGYGMVSGLGWYITKHSYGIYSDAPSKNGFVLADTEISQKEIDSKEIEVLATSKVTSQSATIVTASVAYGPTGDVFMVPAVLQLKDGTRAVLSCGETDLNEFKEATLPGKTVEIRGEQARWYNP